MRGKMMRLDAIVWAFLLLFLCKRIVSFQHNLETKPVYRRSPGLHVILTARGGRIHISEEEDQYDSEEEEDPSDVESCDLAKSYTSATAQSVFTKAVNLVISAVKATTRAIEAIFKEPTTKSSTFITRATGLAYRVFSASFYPQLDRCKGDDGKPSEPCEETTPHKASVVDDFGPTLADSYKVSHSNDVPHVLGGPLSQALEFARSKSRLLVVVVPSAMQGRSKGVDEKLVESLLSKDVSTIADKQARKKESGGSFVIWSTNAGASEAAVALKRLKVQKKRPVLAVVYPSKAIDSRGRIKVVPKILSQHHCNPPPSSQTMASWLDSLRKRHKKQYATMQMHAKETAYTRERRAGYDDSIKSDKKRQEEMAQKAAERIAKELEEKQRLAKIQERRQELKESLSNEPEQSDKACRTVVVRLSDGTSLKRRFYAEAQVSELFNWIDVHLEVERESFEVVTMNGKQAFEWGDDVHLTMTDAGFGKMTGLRLLDKKTTDSTKKK